MTTIQTQRPTLVYVACFYPDLTATSGLLLGSSALLVKSDAGSQDLVGWPHPTAQALAIGGLDSPEASVTGVSAVIKAALPRRVVECRGFAGAGHRCTVDSS
jgi:hypothetical protein